MDERLKTKIEFRLNQLEDNARMATPGRWRRNHGVVTSSVPGTHEPTKFEGYVVAMCDAYDLRKGGLTGHSPDMNRANANARWLETASPHNLLTLIPQLREALGLPERDTPPAAEG